MLIDPESIDHMICKFIFNGKGEEFDETFKEVQMELTNITMNDNCLLEYENIGYHDTNRHFKKLKHVDVIQWEHFPRCWCFVRGIQRSPVDSPHKGQ